MKKSKRKILILTMSCNIPYHQSLLGCVRDTWAKPLIKNKYENITWYSYTACDSKHPKPMVDFENHMIYVNTDDTLRDSYNKTYEAYHLIKDCVDFDYVIRTNTSVFLNIDNLIDRCNQVWDKNENTIITTWTPHLQNEIFFYVMIGYFIGMKRNMFECCVDKYLTVYEDEESLNNDDIIMSKNLWEHFDINDIIDAPINESGRIPWYKPNVKNIDTYKNTNLLITDDPNVINDNVLVRMRPSYETVRHEQHEQEHFYEINNVLHIKNNNGN